MPLTGEIEMVRNYRYEDSGKNISGRENSQCAQRIDES